eukprot:GHVN01077466.1.p2 GENE.GHVN01077466.1~~GHVN01077466.1.p2  ORF type:complete len:145 (-),score=23.20 GHVN01077466.1:60-494(-)
MSDIGETDSVGLNEAVQEEAVLDLMSAIRQVLKKALIHDGIKRGIHEVAKSIESDNAFVCFLAESCSEDAYKKLVKGLCHEKKIPCIEVPDSKELGEWAGLCKVDNDGNPRNIVSASAVCVTDYCEESQGMAFLREHIQQTQGG